MSNKEKENIEFTRVVSKLAQSGEQTIDRLSEERQELVCRIANLEDFMHSHAFAALAPVNQGLRMVQLEAMHSAYTLARRIEKI